MAGIVASGVRLDDDDIAFHELERLRVVYRDFMKTHPEKCRTAVFGVNRVTADVSATGLQGKYECTWRICAYSF